MSKRVQSTSNAYARRLISSQARGGATHATLKGALGKKASYRAERFLVSDLISEPHAHLHGLLGDYPLHDISLRGASIWVDSPLSPVFREGAISPISIRVYKHEVYRGLAKLVRSDPRGSRTKVSFELSQGLLDAAELRRLDAEHHFERDLAEGPTLIQERVPPAYRDAVGRVAHFFQYHQRTILAHQESYQALGLTVPDSENFAFERMRHSWAALRTDAATAALGCYQSSEVLQASKAYTQELVTRHVLNAPLIYRGVVKPLGYSGDYVTMLHLYRNEFEGDDLAGRVFHKLMCDDPLAHGIRKRKESLKQLIRAQYQRFCETTSSNETFRITSLGSGPAVEVSELLQEEEWSRPVRWTLVDQEEEALKFAYQNIHQVLAQRHSQVEVVCLHLSFAQLVRNPLFGTDKDAQHLVYVAGLFDYLRELAARALVQWLYGRIVKGGMLVVGNAAAEATLNPWAIEFMADWALIYRTAPQMHRLTERLDSTAVELISDPAKAFHLLCLRRPQ